MLKKFIITAALLIPMWTMAQEVPNIVVGPRSKQQVQAEKKQEKLKKKAEKENEKGIKQRYKMQDKETRKRMRQSRKEAERVNHNERKGFFLTRWLKKKRGA